MEPHPEEADSLEDGSPQANGDQARFALPERAGPRMPLRPENLAKRQLPPSFPWAVLLALLGVAGALVLLVFLSQGLLLPLAFVAGGIFLLCGFHYIVWGWWLGAAIRREEEEDAQPK